MSNQYILISSDLHSFSNFETQRYAFFLDLLLGFGETVRCHIAVY